MIKAIKIWACIAVIAVGGMSPGPAAAQETPAKPAAKTDPRGPLPAQFGKLGISDEVKDELYQIHEEYDVQVKALAAQIKKLQAEKLAKMEVKLTPAQKTRLKELRDAAEVKKAQAEKLKSVAEQKPGVTAPVVPAPATGKQPE